MKGDAFVRLARVVKRYEGRTVVDAVSLDVAEGETLALLGASGCGKTTLLRLVAGLETPDAGEIWIAGECVAADGRNIFPPRARRIGFVFQDLALWSHMTVAGNLDFVLASCGVPKQARKKRIEEALRMVRIEPFADAYPHRMSGGEQQRAAIARALVGRPRLLLLDEPLSSLDADLKASLLAELAALQKTLNVTTIHVTHDRAEAAALANRVVLMREGRIEHTGTPEILQARLENKTG